MSVKLSSFSRDPEPQAGRPHVSNPTRYASPTYV